MSEIEEGIAIHRVQSSVGALSSSIPKQQSHLCFNHLDIRSQITQFPPHINIENITKRVGIPQSHPQIPPLSPSSQIPGNYQQTEGSHSLLPPRKAHRRSNSDIPFGFSTILQSSPPLIPSRGFKGLEYVKRESIWEKTSGESKGEVVDDIFSTYLNLNNLGRLSSEDLDSRASGTKINGGDNNSDNEATSSIIGSSNNMRREGVKRSSDGDIAPTTRHYRSVSMDSIMGKMNFVDESLKLKPSSDSVGPDSDTFNLEFGNGMFTGVELKKIMTNENLAEIALTDPKRVKRILANRQSAARSKERKMRYISELETKVQTLQTETTTLSAQLTLLQRESTNLTSQNNELKFRLQAMEQQAHLRDALNEALTAEVQRLRIMSTELNGEAAKFCELSLDPRMYNEQSQQQNV